MLRCRIVFLMGESMFTSAVCTSSNTRDQFTQIDQCSQIELRRAYGHGGANHRIEHPSGDRDNDARRTQDLEKFACGAPLAAADTNLMAEIGMPAMMNLYTASDIG